MCRSRSCSCPCCPCLVTVCSSGAIAAESNVARITNASVFISFADNVNQGTNYDGTTVLLVSDLSFSGMAVEPIGKTSTINFRGTFDGQGHVISDLKMNSTSQYMGLFGYSIGSTTRNVVLDSSCSITSSYNSDSSNFVGSIIGYCVTKSGHCVIENNVNMASVSKPFQIQFPF